MSAAGLEAPLQAIMTMQTIDVTAASQPVSRAWDVFCHLSALSGWIGVPLGNLIGPLVVWLIKRGDSASVDRHGKESLNFQISMLIYNVVAAVFCLILVGFFFLAILWVANAVFVIIASIQASEGKLYRYPLTIRFIQ